MALKVNKAWIDTEECVGNALCLEPAGYLIEMNFMENIAEMVEVELPYSEEESVKLLKAVNACPAQAIYIELDDERVINKLKNSDVELIRFIRNE